MHQSFRNTQYLRLNGKAWLKQLLSYDRRKGAHDSCGSFHNLCSYGSCPSVLWHCIDLQGPAVPGKEGQWPTRLQKPLAQQQKTCTTTMEDFL